jgi:hypothetical protein
MACRRARPPKTWHGGERHTDLLASAVIHDDGKSRARLRLWERVIVAWVYVCYPGPEAGDGEALDAWRQPFPVAVHNPVRAPGWPGRRAGRILRSA